MDFEKVFGVGLLVRKAERGSGRRSGRKRVNNRPAKSTGAGQRERARERKLKRRERG